LPHFVIHLRFESFDLLLVEQPLANQEQRKFRQRIAMRFRFPLVWRLVQLLVVAERMRIGAGHRGMNERRPAPLAAKGHRLLANQIALNRIVPSTSATCKPGKLFTSLAMFPPAVCTSTGTEMA
jgi:hypothetical protein